jgi:hypothetical protein
MGAVRLTTFRLGLMLAVAFSISVWPAESRAYTPEEQQACSGDAMRLCGAFIPDVDRITTCMIQNKSQLSPPCRAFFRPDPEEVARPAVSGRPLSIRPVSTKKPVKAKPQKSKKPKKPDAS